MYVETSVVSDCGRFKLSAFVEPHGLEYPALLITDANGKEIAFWDNDYYLYHSLHPLLRDLCEHNYDIEITADYIKKVEKVREAFLDSDFPTVYMILEKGIELGMFNNTK